MKISNNSVVSITYQLKESNQEGEIIQEVDNQEPFVFLFGANQVLPQFEVNLLDKEVGATFEFGIKSEDGYGETNPDAIVDLPINIFMVDGKLADMVQVGTFLPMNDQEGNPMQGLVLEIGKETVKMDFNHPMAGMDLHFTGKVIAVRAATAEELDHGHVHGEGGHHH
ncbi:FKBP-type peptidyl-prolyl cis-trans isomerase [Reichenbachiella agarivorans]|uniref:Peptidyl-prolyl cis-trans isomerase n=1 Tax=Reichenbachiella agarivorans TaxID=2979464 RepID=A0ABY6CNP3_9BACT|nr:FKBP-type peptidyl-prolyl cis-trans isomerase [Reichenbachiella agarivorans]UXP31660.1 FKBP-type peptidyl-prolyl cis-trans isomerase [Reichenbachiella agarivorans]